ncbi:MAG: hypothetical protein ABI411_09780 [Tahibacter sp.]
MFICSPLLLGASNVSYKCKGADGTWSVAACYPGVVAPTDRANAGADPQRRERLQHLRDTYAGWCRLRETEDLAVERCVLDQMNAMAFIDTRLRAAAPDSQESLSLVQCITTFTDKGSQLIDAVAARACYSGPAH